MLAIRMQRTGRKGLASFRVVVQDSRQSPKSGKFVALLGSYDPHAKTSVLAKNKAEFYLQHGAQPSDRVVSLFKKENVKLPKWVTDKIQKQGEVRNPDKLRKHQPAQEEIKETVVADATKPTKEVSEPITVEEAVNATKEPQSTPIASDVDSIVEQDK